ncbi:MAG: DUF2336 domain-containing protein [Bdellovibrionales bacterium]
MGLIDLARDRSHSGRIRLAEALADTFITTNANLSPEETAQLSAFIDELCAGNCPVDIRRVFAERTASSTALPRNVAQKLAMDNIDIARSILKQSPALTDDDLLQVIGMESTPHQIAVAGREAVSQAVADALVVTGNPEVVETLLENFGAKLSRKSVEKCTELAQHVAQLRLPLIERPEFTANDATKLMWWLPKELRQTVLERFGFVGPEIKAGLQPLIEQMLQRFRDHEPTEKEAEHVAAWLADRNAISSQLLVQVLRLRSGPLFTALLAKLIKMPYALTKQCFEEKTGQLLAVMCRAIGMEKAYFASTFMLAYANRSTSKVLNPKVLDSALQAFDRLTQTRAQTMVKAWRDNPELIKSRI